MTGHDHLSFSNLLARSNTGSLYFSGHTHWANNASARNTEIMQKCNEAVESLSSVSNNVSQQIKTPQKPTRRKYKPKVVKEVKIDPKAQTPTKHVPDGQESKTLRRICVWKKEVSKDQECTRVQDAVGETSSQGKKLCRRVLDFEPENGENQSYSSTKHADETESAPREKQLDFGNQESKDCTPSPPSTTKRKLRQSKRKGEEPKSNGSNLSMEKSANRRQGKKPTRLDKIDTPIKKRITGHARVQKMCSINKYIEVCLSGVNLHNIATPINKRTTCHARVQKMCSVNKLMEVSKQLAAEGCSSQSYNKLVDTRVSSSKKKQATKSKNAQTNLKTVLPNLHQFSASSAGLPPDDTLKQLHSPVLDTNRKNSETVVVPYSIKSQRNEIILSSSGAGAMVRSTPVKKQHARPKVDLDTETGKVWNLLMENNKSKGIDGSDEQKAKWWEEERNIYEGRAGSFIAQMRLVQGDRRFTPWKGSVVDSVVGVFLTQNVSDHLSSSAFMNLAAEFPARTCQNSFVSDASQKLEGAGSSSDINPNREHYLSFVKLLQSLRAAQLQGKKRDIFTADTVSVEEFIPNNQYGHLRKEVGVSSNPGTLQVLPNTSFGDCSSELKDFKSLKEPTKSSVDSSEPFCCHQQDMDDLRCQKPEMYGSSSSSVPSTKRRELVTETLIPDINESTSSLDVQEAIQKPLGPDSRQHRYSLCEGLNPMDDATLNAKRKKVLKEEKERFDWDSLRREALGRKGKRNKTTRTMDSVDWEAIRMADVSEVAEIIKSRGMNHKLAKRIQGFLDRLVTEHEGIDLEWLRDVSPDKAKEFLLSFKGLGLKSVECVRLLTLHHLAFPVDTNVGRIAVRLGWVPLQPLPESLQLHLLEMYPMIESIQKYLWPRLCKLDQETLYELHYQMITFGKVFCTKSKPNCNACPMRGECRHFASAFASGKLALPSTEKGTPDQNPLPLHLREPLQKEQGLEVVMHSEPANKVTCCEPIIEEPASPEPEYAQVTIADIEDAFFEDPEEIPTIRLNMDALTSNLKKLTELQDRDMSTALVALTSEAASIPVPKLKNISRLRTEHQVYELPDWHPLLAELELEKREPGDPSSYLLAIWTPGETADSVQPAISKCTSQESGKLCDEEVRLSCNNIVETKSQTVRGTILIPCKTAMRGSFPLNGTYFQVNEVFADHDSSLNPIDVPRDCLWKLTRKTVFFGTSVSSIFRGLSTEKIQRCFWGGYVCVKGFDRKTRAPKPLMARLHFPASKMKKGAT